MEHPYRGPVKPGLILALGSVNADFQVRVDRRPEVSETLLATDFKRMSGGKSANVAFLACKLGLQAQLLAHVGDDDLAEQALAALREVGIDLSCVQHITGQSTGVAMITVPPDGKKGIVMAPNANDCWNEADAETVAKAVAEAPPDSVLVTNCELPDFIVMRALQAAREHSMRSILDPSPADRVSDTLLQLADIVAPNAGEAQSLTDIECKDAHSGFRAGKQLRERGAKVAIVKLADGGCVMADGEDTAYIAAVPVDMVDSTGAGDAFAGALAVAIAERRSHAEAARFAVAASHLAVTGYGSQPAYPDRAQLEEMEKRLTIDDNFL
jgi:ribokinase